jgi:hypothetical protein
MASAVAEYCVYTIVRRDHLEKAAELRGPTSFDEGRPWATARKLHLQATADDEEMLVLFADANDCSELIYWGVLQDILVGEKTHYTVDHLQEFRTTHSPQELVLKSTGQQIAPDFIRPYAICRTPQFMAEERVSKKGSG